MPLGGSDARHGPTYKREMRIGERRTKEWGIRMTGFSVVINLLAPWKWCAAPAGCSSDPYQASTRVVESGVGRWNRSISCMADPEG